MGIAQRNVQAAALPVWLLAAKLRSDHWVALSYFLYTALLAWWFRAAPSALAAACLTPVLLLAWFAALPRLSGRLRDVSSDWLPMALILLAYRQLELFSRPYSVPWQAQWAEWDHVILHSYGLQALVESAGGLFPELLQTVYLFLYAVPVAGLAAVYFYGARLHAWRYLQTLFAGTFLVYAVLPHFPADSPRQLFPHLDPPHFQGLVYSINIWLLDHADISTSVFPSGHVAVAFSAALGLQRTIPTRRVAIRSAFAVTALVWIATIYGRIHYATDGAASIALCLLAAKLLEATTDARS
jgi:membrane-associated phospholipid phosphatase